MTRVCASGDLGTRAGAEPVEISDSAPGQMLAAVCFMVGAHYIALLCGALLVGCMVGEERVVSADEPLPEDLIAGDIIRRGMIEVVVPDPGDEVSIVADLEDGSSIELAVRNPLGGAVELMQPELEPIVIAAGSTAPCADGAYNLAGHKWTVQLDWTFFASSTPTANNKDSVEQGLRNAAAAITTSRNSCGLADEVTATHRYLGRTATAPNIRSESGTITCTQLDRKNVVGFGPLPTGTLGVACTWATAGSAIDSDIRLSTRNAWFALDAPAGCSNKYGIQAVGVHEFGHAFGLNHVSESTHPNLTMSTTTGPCTNAPLSLGLGDVRALRAIY